MKSREAFGPRFGAVAVVLQNVTGDIGTAARASAARNQGNRPQTQAHVIRPEAGTGERRRSLWS